MKSIALNLGDLGDGVRNIFLESFGVPRRGLSFL